MAGPPTFTLGSYPTGGLAIYRFFDVENLEAGVSPLEGHYVNGDDPTKQQAAILDSSDPQHFLLPGGSLLPGNLVIVDLDSLNATTPTIKRTQAATNATGVPTNGLFGVVFGWPWTRYKPLSDAIPPGDMVSVLRGRFVARMDVNSFAAGEAPTQLGDKIYMAIESGDDNLGLYSTTKSGTAANTDFALGEVVSFEQVTGYGPGGMVQISTDPSTMSATSAPQVLAGGRTLVRVQFNIPSVGIV